MASDFRFVARSEIEQVDYFIDHDSAIRSGQMVRVGRRLERQTPCPNGVMSYSIESEYDCTERRYRDLFVATYARPGNRGIVIAEGAPTSGAKSIPPESVAEEMWRYVCKQF